MLKPRMGVPFDHEVLYGKFLSPRPAHHRVRHFDALLVRQRDIQREGFPWTHGQINREASTGTGEIPDRALALEWPSVVDDRTLHRESTVGTNREGHGTLAESRSYCRRGDEQTARRAHSTATEARSEGETHCPGEEKAVRNRFEE